MLLSAFKWAFLAGSALAAYISLTVFMEMPYGLWLSLHDSLVVISLVLAAFVGWKHMTQRASFSSMLISASVYYLTIAIMYLAAYFLTSTFFADKMAWIPFFYYDYKFHSFSSVADYLNNRNNYIELLELQAFSLSLCSILYIAAGTLGYGTRAAFDRVMHMHDGGQRTA